MNKVRKNKKQTTIITLIFSIISLVLLTTIAYSAFSSTMNITGMAHARVEANVRITDFRLSTTNNATSSYEEFGKEHINSNINLATSSSYITYYLEITNYGTTNVGIYNITGLPSGVNYQIKDYNLKDKICDESGKCNSFITKTYELVITTNNSSYSGDIKLNFEFRPFLNITYTNFNNNYLSEIMSGDSATVNLSLDSPKFIDVDSSDAIDYSYSNNILVLNNVTSNIEVIAVPEVYPYDYTGDVQTFNVPMKGLYKIELWGAQGGNNGGLGGYTSGYINLVEDANLYLYVGSAGETSIPEDRNLIHCKFNCGTSTSGQKENPSRYWGTGGGATDIRLVSGNWDNFNSLKSRIMVASAGGGAYTSNDLHSSCEAGAGGGLMGYNGMPEANYITSSHGSGGYGGTQVSGGYNIINNPDDFFYTTSGLEYGNYGYGGFGYGGNSRLGYAYAGGGSGYYGGGSSMHVQAGGGGSSYISGHNGCDAITESSTDSNIIHTGQSIHYSGHLFHNTKMIDGEGYNWTTEKGEYVGMPTHDVKSTMTGNQGSGYAKITLIQTKYQYSITYTDIEGNYQTTINEGENLTINFGSNAPDMVNALVNGEEADYTYKNGIITINNVSGHIEIKPIDPIYEFEYTGDVQTFTVPHTGIYKVELWGASGGYTIGKPLEIAGKGGYVSGNIQLQKNKKLYVYVGEYPSYTSGECYSTNPNAAFNASTIGSCCVGGGATDIRLEKNTWSDFSSLKSRIIVSSGGGCAAYDGNAGDGGGLSGYQGVGGADDKIYTCGPPGTQTSTNFGKNKGGGTSVGGGGYYVGEPGFAANSAGGSSFISGHNGCDAITESSTEENITHTGQSIHYSGYKFTNTIMIDGQGYNWTTEKGDYVVGMPTYDGTSTMIGNEGNGYAKITLLEIN